MSQDMGDTTALHDYADPRDFYTSYTPSKRDRSPRLPTTSFSSPPQSTIHSPPSLLYTHSTASSTARSNSRSPTRSSHRPSSSPGKSFSPFVNSSRSRPNLPTASKPIRDRITRFNQDAGNGERPLIPLSAAEKRRRIEESRPTKLTKPRSPTKLTQCRSHARLQTRRDPPPPHPAMAKLDTAMPLQTSMSHGALSNASPASASRRSARRPLFGEVTYNANGAPDFGYGISPVHHKRRGSDSSLMKGGPHGYHSASQSEADSPVVGRPEGGRRHSRSRSDQPNLRHDSHQWGNDDLAGLTSFSVSPLTDLPLLLNPFPTSDQHLSPHNTPTRIPPQPRVDSRSSNENRSRTPVSKYSRQRAPPSPTSPRRRNDPRAPGSPEKTLRAYIRAPEAQKSPPLRSSRPRQPLSVASTAASRAKATERFEKQAQAAQQAKAQPRRKIPELGRVDFAERRARIEKAMSQNLDDVDLDRRSSRGSSRRRSSAASQTINIHVTREPSLGPPAPSLDPLTENPKSPLYVKTTEIPQYQEPDASAEHTEFEEDEESPDLAEKMGRLATTDNGIQSFSGGSIQNTPIEYSSKHGGDPQSLFSTVLQYRNGTSPDTPEQAASTGRSPVELEGDQSYSARINGKAIFIGKSPLAEVAIDGESESRPEQRQSTADGTGDLQTEDSHVQTPLTPIDPRGQDFLPDDSDITPRQLDGPSDSIQQMRYSKHGRAEMEETFMQRIIRDYEQTGQVDPVLLDELERRGLNSSGTVNTLAGGGSDIATIHMLFQKSWHPDKDRGSAWYAEDQSLVDSRASRTPDPQAQKRTSYFEPNPEENTNRHSNPPLIVASEPDTDEDAGELLSHMVYEGPTGHATPGADSIDGPTPPPKDEGYTPRSSVRYSSDFQLGDVQLPRSTSPRDPNRGSTTSSFSLPEIDTGGSISDGFHLEPGSPQSHRLSIKPPPTPPAPFHAPPPPPPLPVDGAYLDKEDPGAASGEPKSPKSPSMAARFAQSNTTSSSLRPSQESQRADSTSINASQSMSSISIHAPSTDRSSPATTEEPKEVDPVQRRLAKRRNIIKELVDTEYSYHQDMKIIEDIYKATASALLMADDKKTLFGNSDQIEALSLEFYDAIRRSVAPVYVPPKDTRWQTKRGSFGTSSSAENGSAENQPDEQDKRTAVGAVFEDFLPRMELIYATYLKNHEAANKRLAALQQDPKVEQWLKSCHQNASDITSAWDLDSLLVKPVQRILKYPLLLQQLLETTPSDHPDHGALEKAVLESTNISYRINEAKKRADLVDSIVNRKRKDSDMRAGFAKAFGLRTEKVKERIGVKNEFQDADYEELAMKFGGHYVRLQVVMRDVQGSLTEVDRAVDRFNNFAAALETFIEVGQNQYPEIESKWRKFILAIRELSAVALADHKAQVKKRVIEPMVTVLRLHETPQNVMTKRKKRVVDFVRCKQMEKAGQKPDKKTIEGSELYVALTEQLKIDLPKLYSLTAQLIQRCLACHHQIQLGWLWTWQMKLQPVLATFPESISRILPEFSAEYDIVNAQVYSLGLCNGTLLANAASLLSPQLSFTSVTDDSTRRSRPGPITHRTPSTTPSGEPSPSFQANAQNPGIHALALSAYESTVTINGQQYTRARSASNVSSRGRAPSVPTPGPGPPAARLSSTTPKSSYSTSRPPTSNRGPEQGGYQRGSADVGINGGYGRSPRPNSGTSYFSAQQELPAGGSQRYSGMSSSAMPMGEGSPMLNGQAWQQSQQQQGQPQGQYTSGWEYHQQQYNPQAPYTSQQQQTQYTPHMPYTPQSQQVQQGQYTSQHQQIQTGQYTPQHTPQRVPSDESQQYATRDMPVLFVAASLFEFNIDRARREAGYPYLTYVQGEVFDVLRQKGELWLARNQDDANGRLGWIWEQHFVILGRE